MFIIWNTPEKHLGNEQLESDCRRCSKGSNTLVVFQRYFSLFGIPLFPLGKRRAIVCEACDAVTHEREFGENEAREVKSKKRHFKTPIYLFIVPVLIAALLGAGSYLAYQSSQEQEKLIVEIKKNPKVGDYFLMEEKVAGQTKTFYAASTIEKIEDGIIFIIKAEQGTTSKHGMMGTLDQMYDERDLAENRKTIKTVRDYMNIDEFKKRAIVHVKVPDAK